MKLVRYQCIRFRSSLIAGVVQESLVPLLFCTDSPTGVLPQSSCKTKCLPLACHSERGEESLSADPPKSHFPTSNTFHNRFGNSVGVSKPAHFCSGIRFANFYPDFLHSFAKIPKTATRILPVRVTLLDGGKRTAQPLLMERNRRALMCPPAPGRIPVSRIYAAGASASISVMLPSCNVTLVTIRLCSAR